MLLVLRQAAELTQEELAEAAGLAARSIRDLERGRRARPQRRTVQMLVSALGLSDAEAAALLAAGRSGPGQRMSPPVDDGAVGSGLLDRQGQLVTLERAAGEARAGRGGVVLVRAGAGMGKTALLDTWMAGLDPREIRVASASGAELEQGFAFAVLRQLVEPLLARAGDAGRARLLSGPAQSASHALRVEGTGELSPEASLGLLHSLYWLMVHVADEGPVALVVDDVHWADVPSVRWLEYLARRLRGLPLLLVLAGRPDGGAGVEPLLDQIVRQPHCRLVGLPGLDIDSVTHLVRANLGPGEPRFVAACTSAAEGNPLLLHELLRTLADNQVRATDDQAHLVEDFRGRILAGTVVKRLAEEPEPVLRLARALVVLRDEAAWKVAAELAGMGESTARELGRRLRRIGVLASDEPARFGHALVRAAVAEAVLGPVELAAGHARAAELLRRDGAADDLVAAHLLSAEPGGEAWWVDTLRQAARATRGRGAPEVTAAYLRRALREPVSVEERGPLLLELGKDEIQVDVGAARHCLTQASTALTDPYALADAASALGSALFLDHEHERAVDVLARAVEDLRHTDDGTGLAREVSWFLQAQMLLIGYDHMSTISVARQHARRLWDHKLAGDTPGECMVLAALSAPATTGEASAQVANDLLDRALRGGLAAVDTTQMLVTLAGLAFVATDRLDDAAARFDRLADTGGRWGSFLLVSSAMTWQLLIQARRGRQLRLTADFGHPATTADRGLEPRVRLSLMTQVGESLIEQCDLTSATAALTADADFDRVGWTWQGPALLVRSRLLAARGNPAAALAVLHEYGAEENRARVTNLAGAPWRSRAALLHLTLGQRTDALQLATEELELAHQWGTERAIGVASRCLGVIHSGRKGQALLREAVALLKRSPARLELARAHYELGTALLRDGEADEARQALTQALHLAETCGSILLAAQVRAALAAAGVRPKPAPPAAPSLSPTEHRLVELLRAGHSDRQIAQALLLTPLDVIGLIEQAGRKLGAANRSEL
ncbi:AAA family ATPase [Streptomyces sp. WI04-05B]|uniref:AAA family ATPase n=1 Tax=Streptomyces TaxID=1883 RepID=UPI0029AA0B0D|nr:MULTISPECIES: AAA family ATPase [unclassified Streptomyces]MDX2546774.1 AAA family ATPase [Streptomyces sp. WI04-05B]MDX2589570.1 AAA family ATPase [Streptomyces sp. WI04-05A]MDX3750636.1 AAA family ATPase [Streptomyces sp. AK08-02]